MAVLNLTAAGCDGPRGIVSESEAGASSARQPAFHQSTYRLALGDKVKVTVFNEPDVSGEFQVASNGMITLPLGGEVPAVNKTPAELKTAVIGTLNGRYVKNPRVGVEVTAYRPFNVIGEVKNAGQYPFRPGLTVQDAVAMAGGYTYRADTHTLYVRRADAGGEQTIKSDSEQAAVAPGDNIRVPERYF